MLCIDDDVPTDLKARDASGELPVDQPRRRFVHWVQIEVAADVSNFPEGVFAQKNVPAAYGRPGLNDYCRGAGKPEADGTGLTVHARLFLMLVGITIAIKYWRSI